MVQLLLVFGLWGIFPGCQSAPQTEPSSGTEELVPATDSTKAAVNSTPSSFPFPYRLKSPDERWQLPYYLKEVSGMVYLQKETVAMVQDEKARLYIMDLAKNAVTLTHSFGGNGDFEGLGVKGKSAYALRSDGAIFEIPDYSNTELDAVKFKTPLNARNNPEGLCVLPDKKGLLVACKDESGIKGQSYKSKRGFYRFDLKKQKLDEKPFFLVNLKEVEDYLETHAESKKEKEFAEDFRPGSNSSFQPSGVAVHPNTKEYYIIASSGKLIVVLDKQKQLKWVHRLNKHVFQQPEGICFDPKGNLFIASEGKRGSGYILKFAYHPEDVK